MYRRFLVIFLAALGLLLPLALAGQAGAVEFSATYADPGGRGFFDSTPAAPVGGNPGTTVGEQRKLVLERAMAVFARRLQGSQPVLVQATFSGDQLACTATAAVLGGAAAHHATLYQGPAGSPHPVPGVYYHAALANQLMGEDAEPGEPDVEAHFNGHIGSPGCGEQMSWYYGFDGRAPSGAVDLFTVVLHEMSHALGFSDFSDPADGHFLPDGNGGEAPGVFSLFLYDAVTGKRWPDLSPDQRLDSRQNTGKLLWDGPAVSAVSAGFAPAGNCTGAGARVRMFAPGTFSAGSSISHWDTTCTPNLLMEPVFTGRGFLDLTPVALADVGWKTNGSCGDGLADPGEQCDGASGCNSVCTGSSAGTCGDGTIGTGEQCDQGALNGTAGVCCSNACAPQPDGTACSAGTCRAGACVPATATDAGASTDAGAGTDATGNSGPDTAADTTRPDASPADAGPAPAAPDASRILAPDAAVPDSATPLPPPGDAGGCACDTAGSRPARRGRPILSLLALLLLGRHRRRRPTRHPRGL